MKLFLLIAGFIIALISLFNIGIYVFDYEKLADYGKGYVWGNGLLFVIGIILIILGLRKSK